MTQSTVPTEDQLRALAQFTENLVTTEELAAKIEAARTEGRPLRVKQGIDPTAPDVHIGHMVPYRLLRAFQDHGHTAVLIIGDVTARIGDPTGLDAERRQLDEATVKKNAERYAAQIFRVVDPARAEVRFQSEWFGDLGLADTVDLLSKFSVAQMLAHETFRARLDSGRRLSLHELVYPVLQAQDSVAVEADVEVGGSDQLFNMLCGRDLLREGGRDPQVVITTPLLPGTDGRKMSKSFGNHIPVEATPDEMYGKLMSVPDEFLGPFYRLASGIELHVAEDALRRLSRGELHPRDAKAQLAAAVVTLYHGAEAAAVAADAFDRLFRARETPTDMPQLIVEDATVPLATVISRAGLTESAAQARRLIAAGGVRCDGQRIDEPGICLADCLAPGAAVVLRVGKRRFLRLRRPAP